MTHRGSSLWTDERQHSENYDIPEDAQKAAAKKIRRTGAEVWKDGEVWVVIASGTKIAETISPRVLVDRAVRDHYGEVKEDEPKRTGRRPVQVPRDSGKPDRPVVLQTSVDSDSDKRDRKQKGSGSNGRGTGKANRSRTAEPAKATRKKNQPVRKQRERVPARPNNNNAGKARVGPGRKSGTNKPKSRPAKRNR